MNLFSPPVMLQAGSGLKSVGRIRIRSKMDRIRNTEGACPGCPDNPKCPDSVTSMLIIFKNRLTKYFHLIGGSDVSSFGITAAPSPDSLLLCLSDIISFCFYFSETGKQT